jgi:carboxyl-terminal processing protease
MKYLRFLLPIPFIMFSTDSFSQSKYQNIEIYVKVWGFIKYYHPNVAGGTINWDSVFVAHIDKIIVAKNSKGLNAEVAELIDAPGPDKNMEVAPPTGDIFTKNHDLGWLEHSTMLSQSNKSRLLYIFTHRNRGTNRFVKSINQTDYSGENTYEQMTWPTLEYRLLFLARFWNAINYYDPYKFITAENWNSVLTRFIPKVQRVKDTTAYHKILLQLAVELHDGHAQLWGRDDIWGKYWLPFYITVLHDTVVITHTDGGGGIKQGDLLIAIDNEPIAKRMARFKQYTTSSNLPSLNRHLEQLLLLTPDMAQQVTVKRGDKTFTIRVSNILITQRNWQYINNYTANDKGYEMIGKSIIRVYTDQYWKKNVDTIKALMRTKKAIIFDARSYMDDDAFYNIFDMFLPVPTPINYDTKIMPDEPGYFKWVLSPKMGGVNPQPYSGTVIILADERCQSQGEYTVMTLQTIPHSVTIGSQTCGLDGADSYFPMGGGMSISHSGYGIYYPDKTPTQQRGVKIDIPVKKSVESVRRDEDVAMEEALKYLKSKGFD